MQPLLQQSQDLIVDSNSPQTTYEINNKNQSSQVHNLSLPKSCNKKHYKILYKTHKGIQKPENKQHKKYRNKQAKYYERTSVISLKKKERTLNIISANIDALNTETIDHTINKMLKYNILIAALQETKTAHDCSYYTDKKFKIMTAAAAKGKNDTLSGGVGFIISPHIAGMIKNVRRHSSRVIEITLQNTKEDIPVRIYSIYAPHNGYTLDEKINFWRSIKYLYQKNDRNSIIITCIDANGQLGQGNCSEIQKQIIGRHTNAPKTEQGNGKHLRNFCCRNHMIPMNTQFCAQDKKNAYVTWKHPNKTTDINRQIDYILINQRYRNNVTYTGPIHNWTCNPNNVNQQHIAVIMKITLANKDIGKDKIRIEEKRIEDQKKLCPYDKNEFRNDPMKLRKYLLDNEKEILERIHSCKSNEPDELIKNIDTTQTDILTHLYPYKVRKKIKRNEYWITAKQKAIRDELNEQLDAINKTICKKQKT